VTSIVHVDATDADGDPLTWSTGAQPTTPGSSVSTADQARGDFAFTAANEVTTDTFEAIATDGVPGHETRAIINVKVVNDPPKITCTGLVTKVDTRVAVLPENCVSDPNHDPVTIGLRDAKNGTVERVAGVWYFVPKPGSTATGSFMLDATDNLSDPVSAMVLVTVASLTGSVTLNVDHAGRTRVIASGMALRIGGTAVVAPKGESQPITWDFGDHTIPVQGPRVAHRYRKPGQYVIKAQAGVKPVTKTVTVKVIVRRRAVEVVGTPRVADGVLQVTVRTRTAGTLLLRADSRSQTIRVPATPVVQALRIQVTTGPLVRLTLRLTPSKKAPKLLLFSARRLVMVSPRSAG
jgi:hypothetical protein